MASKKPISANNINVTGDFIAGDQYNHYYTGDFASLAEYYISPDSVFQRVRTDDFIGRDWLTEKVDAFLNDPNRKSGAFLLIGDAGVGKTSFMAHLVKERRYLHLFAEQAPGQAMLQRAMQSLGSQLVTRYQIDPYKDRNTLNALSVFPDFLERILRLAASKLTEGEKIVVICDALDEAGIFPDHFVFGLPKELPDGVYFILSQRPVNVKLPNFEPVIENLESQGEGNLLDLETYLSTVAKRPEVAGQIRSKEYSEDFFIRTLKEKSQGVWMYLHYIIKEIENGARAPLDLANLPTGLVGYYAEYWDAWRTGKHGKGEEAWDELYAPLLTTLAAAQEAIPLDWLIRWADVTAKPREVTRLLTEHWRAFITEKVVNGQKAYTPYHLSFKDFITGKVNSMNLQPTQANLVNDLATQAVDAHKRIANAFEKECNGKWEKLAEQDYPRMHLTAHLNGAGKYETLRILLTEGDEEIKWAEARKGIEKTYSGYLTDLLIVWGIARQKRDYVLALRCMLIESSICSLVSNFPPSFIEMLVKSNYMNETQILALINQQYDQLQKARSLILVTPYISNLLLSEFINISDSISDELAKSNVFIALLEYKENNELVIDKSINTASKIKDTYIQALMFKRLWKRVGDTDRKSLLLTEALNTIRKIKDNYYSFSLLSEIAKESAGFLRVQILEEAFTYAFKIENQPARACALIKILSLSPHEMQELKFDEVLNIVKNLEDNYSRSKALESLYVALKANPNLEYLLDESLAAACVAKTDYARLLAFETLVTLGSLDFKKEVILSLCEFIIDKQLQSLSLANILRNQPFLSNKYIEEITFEGRNETFEVIPYRQYSEKLIASEEISLADKINQQKTFAEMNHAGLADIESAIKQLQLIKDGVVANTVASNIIIESSCFAKSKAHKGQILFDALDHIEVFINAFDHIENITDYVRDLKNLLLDFSKSLIGCSNNDVKKRFINLVNKVINDVSDKELFEIIVSLSYPHEIEHILDSLYVMALKIEDQKILLEIIMFYALHIKYPDAQTKLNDVLDNIKHRAVYIAAKVELEKGIRGSTSMEDFIEEFEATLSFVEFWIYLFDHSGSDLKKYLLTKINVVGSDVIEKYIKEYALGLQKKQFEIIEGFTHTNLRPVENNSINKVLALLIENADKEVIIEIFNVVWSVTDNKVREIALYAFGKLENNYILDIVVANLQHVNLGNVFFRIAKIFINENFGNKLAQQLAERFLLTESDIDDLSSSLEDLICINQYLPSPFRNNINELLVSYFLTGDFFEERFDAIIQSHEAFIKYGEPGIAELLMSEAKKIYLSHASAIEAQSVRIFMEKISYSDRIAYIQNVINRTDLVLEFIEDIQFEGLEDILFDLFQYKSQGNREDVLMFLKYSVGNVSMLSGDDVFKKTVNSIVDVSRWWP